MAMRPLFPLIIALFLGAAFSAAPSPPKWPSDFNAMVDLSHPKFHHQVVGRWFFASSSNMERFDTSSQYGYDVDIRMYGQGMRYTYVHYGHDDIRCTVEKLNGSMPIPSFTDYTYAGQTTVEGRRVDSWTYSANNLKFEYYDDAQTTDPVRMVTMGTVEEIISFFDFKAGTQDPQLFNTTRLFPDVKCTPPTSQYAKYVRFFGLDERSHSVEQKFDVFLNPTSPQTNVSSGCDSGQASWYDCTGNGACGPCNTDQYICAHKTLACGCPVTVTDTASGKSVNMKVEDRGPYVTGRIVDLNHAPAEAIGMISAGVINARLCYSC